MAVYAFVSDIHGNKVALDAVLEDMDKQTPQIQGIFCPGDIVGYGPRPRECISTIRERNIICVRGNHDDCMGNMRRIARCTSNARVSLEWTHKQISEQDKAYLKNLPLLRTGSGFIVAHASPIKPENFEYIMNPEDSYYGVFSEIFKGAPKDLEISFIGHTHSPTHYSLEKNKCPPRPENVKERIAFGNVEAHLSKDAWHIINCGSVGQPRDDYPTACYVIYDTQTRLLKFRRVQYDIERVQRQISIACLPESLARRLLG